MIVDSKVIVNMLMIVITATALYFAFTKEPVVIDHTSDIEILESRIDSATIEANTYRLTADSMLKSIVKKDSAIAHLTNKLESLKDSMNYEIKVIAEQTLKDDSSFFAQKSGAPVYITRDSNVVITPIQLKFANINIATNSLSKGIIHTQGIIISSLRETVAVRDSLIIVNENENNALRSAVEDGSELASQKDAEIKKEKKEAKKRAINSFFKGVGAGAAAILVVILLVK